MNASDYTLNWITSGWPTTWELGRPPCFVWSLLQTRLPIEHNSDCLRSGVLLWKADQESLSVRRCADQEAGWRLKQTMRCAGLKRRGGTDVYGH